MKRNLLVLAFPKIDGRHVFQELACPSLTSRAAVPYSRLLVASHADAAGAAVDFLDCSLDGIGSEDVATLAADYEFVFTQASAAFYERQHGFLSALASADCRLILLADPVGYAPIFANRYREAHAVLRYSPALAVPLLLGGSSRHDIPGCCFWDGHSVIDVPGRTNGYSRTLPLRLGLVPKRYWGKYGAVTVQATDGCCYGCKFCFWGGDVRGSSLEFRDPRLVADDLAELSRMFPMAPGGLFYLGCAQLTTSASWLTAFAERKQAVCPEVRFFTNVSAMESRRDRIELLASIGMAEAHFGIESFSDSVLRRLGKRQTVERCGEMLAALAEIRVPYVIHLRKTYLESSDEVEEFRRNAQTFVEEYPRPYRTNLGYLYLWKGLKLSEELLGEEVPLNTHPGYTHIEPTFLVHRNCLSGANEGQWKTVRALMQEGGWQ